MDIQTVRKVATLAQLEMDDETAARRAAQLGNIMKFVEQLGEVNTDNVEPLASVADIALKLRKDEITDGGDPQKVLANAPETVGGYFVVPKIVEQEE